MCWLTASYTPGKELQDTLLDQLLCLEEAPQVEDLPCSQTDETAHGEYAEVQHTSVGGLCSGQEKWDCVNFFLDLVFTMS